MQYLFLFEPHFFLKENTESFLNKREYLFMTCLLRFIWLSTTDNVGKLQGIERHTKTLLFSFSWKRKINCTPVHVLQAIFLICLCTSFAFSIILFCRGVLGLGLRSCGRESGGGLLECWRRIWRAWKMKWGSWAADTNKVTTYGG